MLAKKKQSNPDPKSVGNKDTWEVRIEKTGSKLGETFWIIPETVFTSWVKSVSCFIKTWAISGLSSSSSSLTYNGSIESW